MNVQTRLVLTAGILAAAALAACGGGGTSHTPATTPGNAGDGSGITQPSSGARLTVTIDRAAPSGKHHGSTATRRAGAARRSPAYVSNASQGLQVTITSGTSSQTLYYSLATNSSACAVVASIETCSFVLPSVGTTETVSALELDQPPANLSVSTGQGTAFPSNSNVLAVGSTSVVLTPGAITDLQLSLNPVAATLLDDDCGRPLSTFGIDASNRAAPRIVLPETAGGAAVTFAGPTAIDAAGQSIAALDLQSVGCLGDVCTGQPFVDVNGSPAPITVTSNSSHITVGVGTVDQYYFSSPIPFPSSQTVSFPDSSTSIENPGIPLVIGWDGSPAAVGSTVTLTNGLSAPLPTFYGSPVPGASARPATYASTLSYVVSQVSVTPTSVNISPNGAGGLPQFAVVTGSDPGSLYTMALVYGTYKLLEQPGSQYPCPNSATPVALIYIGMPQNGTQQFTVTAQLMSSPGTYTCQFGLADDSGAATNPVTITVTQQ